MLAPLPLPKSRLEALTDGIFAVTMTLLVLDLTGDGLQRLRQARVGRFPAIIESRSGAELKDQADPCAENGCVRSEPLHEGLTDEDCPIILVLCYAEVAEWQTRRTQNPVG